MSPHSATYLSLLSILLINPLHSQTGKGCHYTTCSAPGQVRIDAIIDANGNFEGGCYCGCDPGLYNSNSPKYCDNPRVINFNSNTLLGDCSCNCPTFLLQQCTYPQIWDDIECECVCPTFTQTSCNAPATWRNDVCTCACDIGTIGGPCIHNGQFMDGTQVLQDCTCDRGTNINNNIQIQCSGVQIVDPTTNTCKCPSFLASARINCMPPMVWNDAYCFCGCAIGSVGGPCVQNGNFIQGTTVQADCTCNYGVVNNNAQIPSPPSNVVGVCYYRGEACTRDEHCCSNICKISQTCW